MFGLFTASYLTFFLLFSDEQLCFIWFLLGVVSCYSIHYSGIRPVLLVSVGFGSRLSCSYLVGVPTWVAAEMETTKEGTLEQVMFTSRPSDSNTMRLPSGQITWSTEDRTFSQVSSGVRSEFCAKQGSSQVTYYTDKRTFHQVSFRVHSEFCAKQGSG